MRVRHARLPLPLAILPLVPLVAACCFFGAPASSSGGASAPPAPVTATPVAPTAGRTCHLDIDVRFAPTKDDGAPWDVGGGAPDPFAIVRQDGAEIARTARVQDAMSAHWALDVACDHARPIDIEVLDGDLSIDDPAFDYTLDPDSSSVVSPRGQTVEGFVSVTRS